jgi:hypothetical protein
MMKRIYLFLLFALMAVTAGAQEKKDTLRVLAIGNSFSEDAVEQYLWELGQEAGVEMIIGNAYRGGWSLAGHWNDARNRAADTEYRKVVDGEKTNMGKYTLKGIITDEPWDVITLQQVSQESGQPASYEPGLSLMIGYVTALATDSVRLGFHQTWAYAQDSEHKGFARYNNNQYMMYQSITTAVKLAMQYHKGDLTFYVPSGTAIQNARTSLLATTKTNDNAVNRELTRDGYHLNYTIGRYIVACTWFEVMTGKSVVGMKFRPKSMAQGLATIAQRAAHAAVMAPTTVTPI